MAENKEGNQTNEPAQSPNQAPDYSAAGTGTSPNPYQPTTEPLPFNFNSSGYKGKASTKNTAQTAPYEYRPQPQQQQQQAPLYQQQQQQPLYQQQQQAPPPYQQQQQTPLYQQNYATSKGRVGVGRKAKDECCGWKKKTCIICWIVVAVISVIVIALSAVGFYCLANGCGSSSDSKNKDKGGGILRCHCQGQPDCYQQSGELTPSHTCKSKEEQCHQKIQRDYNGRPKDILERGCKVNPDKYECLQSAKPSWGQDECWCRTTKCLNIRHEIDCAEYCAGGTKKQI